MIRKADILKIGLFLVVLFIGIGVVYMMNLDSRTLPIYNPVDLNPALVDSSKQKVTKNHQVAGFSLINQLGETVTEAIVKDKIYVADFFFTTCQTICPKMSTQMQRVQEEFIDDDEVMILSHTVYPENDSVEVLKDYAEEYGVDINKWVLLTGDKKHIYDLARTSYFAVTTKGSGDAEDFIHTENFILVDKDKRLRGFYDGTSPEDIDRLIEDIHILGHEYEEREQ